MKGVSNRLGIGQSQIPIIEICSCGRERALSATRCGHCGCAKRKELDFTTPHIQGKLTISKPVYTMSPSLLAMVENAALQVMISELRKDIEMWRGRTFQLT
jgi:hypothetical protein